MTDTSQQLYVSRPQTVEAIQWTGDNWTAVSMFAGDAVDLNHSTRQLWLRAGKDGAQEWVPVPVGHWLVHQPGDRSDIWPIDPDYFAAKYQPADPEQKWVPVPVGHWLVHQPGDPSRSWPIDPDYFDAEYQPADHEQSDQEADR